MGFDNLDRTTDVFLIEDATNCTFQNVSFSGPLITTDLISAADDTASIRFNSTSSLICNQIEFADCKFGGTTYGVNTNQQIKAITFTNCQFDTLYQGVLLGTGTVINGGPTGVRIVGNSFDNIYAEGIIFGDVSLNASGHNIFYDVGNNFDGIASPVTAIIDIQSDNNVSISDLFARTDAEAADFPRININATTSIATTNSKQINIGQYVRQTGTVVAVTNNSSGTVTTVNGAEVAAFSVNYTIVRGPAYRTGTLTVASSAADSTGDLTSVDDYVENNQTGITLSVSESLDTITVDYLVNNAGQNATITYSVVYLA
jgi:hypothetical protein